ncbi:hypothetical protein ZWY2020_015928 [Hordeum vulgare]|nr:hypothetical protein ZWY2020_015928 [Hordeum vulgare]
MATPLRSRLLPLPVLLLVLAGAAAIVGEQDEQQPITHPGCPDKCGNVSIPFPFGLMPGCFREGFQVTCDHSFDPPRAFLAGSSITLNEADSSAAALLGASYLEYSYPKTSWWLVEVMDLSVDRSEARAHGPITSRCSTNVTHFKLKEKTMTLEEPLAVSEALNAVVGVGWSVSVMDSSRSTYPSTFACRSELAAGHLEHARNGSCAGQGCCEAALSSKTVYSTVNGAAPEVNAENNTLWRTSPCSYAMVVEKSRYSFSTADLYGYEVLLGRFPRGVPVVLDFAIVGDAACPGKDQRPPPDYACVSNNSYCANATVGQSSYAPRLSYVCKCSEHYKGNPYIADGCRDIDECQFPDLYNCSSKGICINRLNGYDCPCKPGMKGDGKLGHCAEKFPLVAKAIVGPPASMPPTTAAAEAAATASLSSSSSSSSELASLSSSGPNPYALGLFGIRAVIDYKLDLHIGPYSTWHDDMELQVAKFGLLDHLAPRATAPPGDTTWRLLDLDIKSWILATISDELKAMVKGNSSARDVQGTQPVASYCGRIKAIGDTLADVALPQTDDALIVALIHGLHARHKMTAKIIQRESATISFAEAQNMLVQDETMEQSSDRLATNTALLAAHRPAPSGSHGGQRSYGPSGVSSNPNTGGSGGTGLPSGSPSPNQGKPKRKRFSNHGGYGSGSGWSPPNGVRPWTGVVQAWPQQLTPPFHG